MNRSKDEAIGISVSRGADKRHCELCVQPKAKKKSAAFDEKKSLSRNGDIAQHIDNAADWMRVDGADSPLRAIWAHRRSGGGDQRCDYSDNHGRAADLEGFVLRKTSLAGLCDGGL